MAKGFTIKFEHVLVYSIVLNSVFLFCMGCTSRYATRDSRMTNSNLRQSRENKETTYDCPEDQVTCKSGNQCILRESQCDGKYDCEDYSDESNFSCKHYPKCPKGMFRCKYGGCIHANLVCNKIKDCMDRSDEESRSCPNIRANPTTRKPSKPTTTTASTNIRVTSPKKANVSAVTSPTTRSTGVTPNRNTSTTVIANHSHCELPPSSADRSYTVYNSSNKQVLGNGTVPALYSLVLTCKSGFSLGTNNGNSDASQQYRSNCTSDGTWNPPIKECLRTCDPISHPSNVTFECVFEGFSVNCTDVLIAGTQVTSRCDDLQVSSKLNSSSSSIKCNENGEWDNVIHDCPSNVQSDDNFGNDIISTAKAELVMNAPSPTTRPSNFSEWPDDHNNALSIPDGDLVTQATENEKIWYIVIGLVLVSIAVILQVMCTILVVTKMVTRLKRRYNIP